VPHAAMSPNNVAVITGGASGIGLGRSGAVRRSRNESLHRGFGHQPSRRSANQK